MVFYLTARWATFEQCATILFSTEFISHKQKVRQSYYKGENLSARWIVRYWSIWLFVHPYFAGVLNRAPQILQCFTNWLMLSSTWFDSLLSSLLLVCLFVVKKTIQQLITISFLTINNSRTTRDNTLWSNLFYGIIINFYSKKPKQWNILESKKFGVLKN